MWLASIIGMRTIKTLEIQTKVWSTVMNVIGLTEDYKDSKNQAYKFKN